MTVDDIVVALVLFGIAFVLVALVVGALFDHRRRRDADTPWRRGRMDARSSAAGYVLGVKEWEVAMRAEPAHYWYVQCSKCREDILVGKAPSPEEIERAHKRTWTASCPHCGNEDTYPPDTVHRGVVVEETDK
jgi:hypothetical protein